MGNMTKIHTIEVKECNDGSGDSYLDFPSEIFDKLDWKEGDELKFLPQEGGSFMVKKVSTETVELDFDDDELFKYMQIAHKQGITFNELCENALNKALAEDSNEVQ